MFEIRSVRGGSPLPIGRKYTAPALEKGLDILELLAERDSGLAQAEIARELDRSVSEIFRMLVVLQDRGYIAQDPDSDRYILTTLLFELAHRTPMLRRLTILAGPVMQRLAKEINQSVHLGVISDDAVLVVAQADSPGNNVMSVRLGAKIELWRASSGRVILAHLSPEELDNVIARVPLPADMLESRVRSELAQIARSGHEVMDSFVMRGVVNISTPIIDHSGHAIAALTVPHVERYHDIVGFNECRNAVIKAALGLTKSLGGSNLRNEAELAPDDSMEKPH